MKQTTRKCSPSKKVKTTDMCPIKLSNYLSWNYTSCVVMSELDRLHNCDAKMTTSAKPSALTLFPCVRVCVSVNIVMKKMELVLITNRCLKIRIMWFVHNLMQMCITHTTFVPYAHAWLAAEFFPPEFDVIQQTMDSSHAVILDSKFKDNELT